MKKRPDKNRFSNTDGFVVFMDNTYVERTSRPIYAITFLLPFILLYEIGTILFNTGIDNSQVRVVSFVWIKEFLGLVGLNSKVSEIGAPLVVLIILLAMQITSRKKWTFRISDHLLMAAECICLAVPLIVLSLLLNRPQINITSLNIINSSDNIVDSSSNIWGIIATGVGAGIYEELIFRLILICILMMIFQDLFGFKHNHSVIMSVLISAMIFSLHHHFIFTNGKLTLGDPFSITRFIFRTFAGIYFAVVYAVRGFGITAATHSFYDIIIAVLNSFIFSE